MHKMDWADKAYLGQSKLSVMTDHGCMVFPNRVRQAHKLAHAMLKPTWPWGNWVMFCVWRMLQFCRLFIPGVANIIGSQIGFSNWPVLSVVSILGLMYSLKTAVLSGISDILHLKQHLWQIFLDVRSWLKLDIQSQLLCLLKAFILSHLYLHNQ